MPSRKQLFTVMLISAGTTLLITSLAKRNVPVASDLARTAEGGL